MAEKWKDYQQGPKNQAVPCEYKGIYMKGGGMDRDPRPRASEVVFKHGAAETITKGAPEPERHVHIWHHSMKDDK